MNIPFQILDTGSGEELIVLQKKVWKRILEALEELDDILAYDAAKANPDKEFFPLDEITGNVSREAKSKS